MQHGRTVSAVHRRLDEFLAQLLARQTREGNERLAPLRVLAAQAGVSYPTMQRALAALARQGVLTIRHGSGVTLGTRAPATEPPTVIYRISPGELAAKLEKEVLAGRWSGDETFPSPKQLRARLGISHERLKKALGRMVQDGYLERWGRGFRVRPLVVRSDARTVALVLRGGPDGEVVYPSLRSQDDFRSLEIECTRAGVRLSVITADPIGGRWAFPGGDSRVLYRPDSTQGLLGYLVWTSSIGDRMLAALAPMLSKSGRPVAVLDEDARRPHMAGLVARSTSCHFTIAGSQGAGRNVGRMLLAYGHRNVGWLAAIRGAHWSGVRLDGLREEYRTAGLSDAVTELVSRDVVESPSVVDSLDSLVRMIRGVRPARSRESLDPVLHLVESNSETLRVMLLRDDRVRRYLPLMERAFELSKERGCTAWVADSDGLALTALAYLRGRGVRVPRDMSVVGFDNSREASEQSLSSYSFNGAAYMHAMLRFVLGMAPSLARTGGGAIEFDGFVVERSTSAKAART